MSPGQMTASAGGASARRIDGQTGAKPLSDNKADLPRRTCILVLGMHRSGTSALTRVLSLLGAALPKNILGAGPGNETGHWEPVRLIQVHDQMLAEAGSSWDDWRKLDLEAQLPDGRLDHYRAEIRNLIEDDYGDAPLFVVKEPRICRFVGLYRNVLDEMGIDIRSILLFRNPLSVAASLEARNEIENAQAFPYWLRHVLDAEAGSRTLPRAVVSYEALMSDWRTAIMPLLPMLQIDWPVPIDEVAAEIDDFLSSDHQHHTFSISDLDTLPATAGWTRRAYGAMSRLETDPQAARTELDAVAAEFTPASAFFADALGAEREAHHRWSDTYRRESENSLAVVRAELDAALAQQAALAEERDAVRAECDAANAALNQAASERDTAVSEREKATVERDKATAEMNALVVERDKALQEILAMRQQAEAEMHDARTIKRQYASRLGQKTRAISRLEQTLAETVQQHAVQLAAHRSEAQASLAAARAEMEAMAAARDKALAERDAAVSKQEAVLADQEAMRNAEAAFVNSTSWRVTAPLRWVKLCVVSFKAAVKRVVRGIPFVDDIIHIRMGLRIHVRKPGDFWRLSHRALKTLLHRGVSGLRADIRRAAASRLREYNSSTMAYHARVESTLPIVNKAAISVRARLAQLGLDRKFNYCGSNQTVLVPEDLPSGGMAATKPLKVIFVMAGPLDSNSGYHVTSFARELVRRGHTVAVCASSQCEGNEEFTCFTHDEVRANATRIIASLGGLNDARDLVVHSWTPREVCIELVNLLVEVGKCPFFVHLEDNEDFITASSLGMDVSQLMNEPIHALEGLPNSLSHPVRFREFIRRSTGATVIVDRLAEFIPPSKAVLTLEPGIDTDLFYPIESGAECLALRRELGVQDDEKICVYNGNVHSANATEVGSLYVAILVLNRRGYKVRLIRTGLDFVDDSDISLDSLRANVIELGFVDRSRMSQILSLADFFVQPGRPAEFNDYRFPSKVPEFLSMGRPVVLPRTNIGLRLRDGVDALLMERGDGIEIADRVEQVLKDPALARQLGENARAFANSVLSWNKGGEALERFFAMSLD